MTFREQLLAGRRIAAAGDLSDAITSELRRLGAWLDSVPDELAGDEDGAAGWVTQRLPISGLVFDARPSFGAGGEPGLQRALQHAWVTARAVATGALIPAADGGRLLFVAPTAEAGQHATAVRAGLENLARTLSVEWARFAVTAVAVWPGEPTGDDQLVALLAFLLSDAGGYYSGCRFELGAVGGAQTFIPAS